MKRTIAVTMLLCTVVVAVAWILRPSSADGVTCISVGIYDPRLPTAQAKIDACSDGKYLALVFGKEGRIWNTASHQIESVVEAPFLIDMLTVCASTHLLAIGNYAFNDVVIF